MGLTGKAGYLFAMAAVCVCGIALSPLAHLSTSARVSQSLELAGVVQQIAIDDGTSECAKGPSARGASRFGWANKLTPESYPATLRSISIEFNRDQATGRDVKRDALYQIVVFLDPEKNGPDDGQQAAAAFTGRARGSDQTMTFNLVSPLTISSGSFIVGAVDQSATSNLPALVDIPGKSNPPGSESFITLDAGAHWTLLAGAAGLEPACQAGSFLIRSTLEYGSVDAPQVIKFKDPLAIEPWAAAFTFTNTVVANYGSDNVTIINNANGEVQNIPVGDGPGATPDGPFGIAPGFSNEFYVTLFGSNQIPKKGVPVDYSKVGEGRVALIDTDSNGAYKTVAEISVGKGPRFPVTQLGSCKLYVPCGGADRVDVVDLTSNRKVREIPVGRDPSSCVLSMDGAKLYVTNFGDGTISVIDTETDEKIKDIPAPKVSAPGSVDAALAQYPWSAAISGINANLYVAYWGTAGGASPDGAIVEFDTCSDEFIRAIVDDSARGTSSGSAAPIEQDGGGPFGVTSLRLPSFRPGVFFTNDALGIVGLIDARIDQVVSPLPFGLASCSKPRAIRSTILPRPSSPNTFDVSVCVACGAPDNEVLVIRVPLPPENIPNVPVVSQINYKGTIKVEGSGFVNGTRIDAFLGDAPECVSFKKKAKIKDEGRMIVQKGSLANGRKLDPRHSEEDEVVLFRVVNPDGSARLADRFSFGAIRSCSR
jgi:YVTN family beta-propeller protein